MGQRGASLRRGLAVMTPRSWRTTFFPLIAANLRISILPATTAHAALLERLGDGRVVIRLSASVRPSVRRTRRTSIVVRLDLPIQWAAERMSGRPSANVRGRCS
jgi:hypothetical protein